LEICPEKSIILVKLPEKIEIFSPGSKTPHFQTRLTPLTVLEDGFLLNNSKLVT